MSGAERLVEAIERSISSGNLSSEMREQVKEMIAALKEPKNQAILGGALAAVGIAQFTPAGPVVDSIVGILGYILAGKAVLEAAPDLARFVTKALEAKDDSDFDQAGQYFARGISPLLVQAGTTLVGMGVAKATSAGAKLVGKRIAALKVSKNPITSEGGKLRVDPAIIAKAEGATAAAGGKPLVPQIPKAARDVPAAPAIARAVDLEEKADLARKYLGTQNGELGKKFRNGGGNVSVGELKTGNTSTPVQAFSGEKDLKEFAKFVPNGQRTLPVGGVGEYIRDVDAEAKILEEVTHMTQPGTKGTLRVFTEKEPCKACAEAFKNLQKHRPNLTIEIHWKGGSTILPAKE